MNITKENTVAEIVSKKLGSDQVFSKYKIDFCCGGGMTLENACKESGVEFDVLKQEIEAINNKITGTLNTNDLDIQSLIIQAKEGYHTSISEHVFKIIPFAAKVAEVHGAVHHEVVEINEHFKGIESVLTEMLKNSILSLYPIMEEVLELNRKQDEVTMEQLQAFQKAVIRNEIAQKLIGDTFKEISKLSSHYSVPVGACNSYKFLYEKLHELEHQVHNYMHLEKNVLIPKVLEIIA
jgi:regulator of cell morphogenesis and NO signaling